MIDLELRTQIDMALRSAEPDAAFRALAEAEARRTSANGLGSKAAAFARGRAMGRAAALIACARVDEHAAVDGEISSEAA